MRDDVGGFLPLQLVIFDCDGTLVDSQAAIYRAATAAFVAHGLAAPTLRAVRHVVGLSLREAVERLLPDAAEAPLIDSVTEAYKNSFMNQRRLPDHDEPLFPGIRSLLDHLDAIGCLMGVATGKSMRGLEATLEHHGLSNRFVSLQTADRCMGKPHPEMVLNCLAETGIAPARALVVGDTTYDMEMAANAGVRAIGVAWGYHEPEALAAAGAAAVISGADDLVPLLAAARAAA